MLLYPVLTNISLGPGIIMILDPELANISLHPELIMILDPELPKSACIQEYDTNMQGMKCLHPLIDRHVLTVKISPLEYFVLR